MNFGFWQGKRVFLTGHTGFKGGWLALWLQRMGARVTGYALPPVTSPNLFTRARVDQDMVSLIGDIKDLESLKKVLSNSQPEIVFHLAAQPLVRYSYANPVETYATNLMGTVHVLEAIRTIEGVRAAVMVTTDKVYQNQNWFWPYRETDALGGHDPYSASKAASELAIESYRMSFLAERNVAVASARAGNVIGGGDWSDDRLLPDAIRAWQNNQPLTVRRPAAVRPWQHVLEPLYGYLMLAEKVWESPELAGSYNFGPRQEDAVPVRCVIEQAQKLYGNGEVVCQSVDDGPHEANLLSLDNAKACAILGVSPVMDLSETLQKTIAWYRADLLGNDARELCHADINSYLQKVSVFQNATNDKRPGS